MAAAHSLISGTKLSSSPAICIACRSSRGLSSTETFSHAACSGSTTSCALSAFHSSDIPLSWLAFTFSSTRGISSAHKASSSSAVGGGRLASAVRASIFA